MDIVAQMIDLLYGYCCCPNDRFVVWIFIKSCFFALFLTFVAVVVVIVGDNDEDRGIYRDKEGDIVYAD